MTDRESMEIRVTDAEDTIKLGEIIGKSLEPGSIIALRGGLGAGKTVLVKGIARGLGIEDEPVSPTFVIMNAYEGRIPLYHFDLYRISGADELTGIGADEFLYGGGVSAVEWAERVEEIFPEYTIYIDIEMPGLESGVPENTREIKIEGKKEWVSSFRSTAEQALPASTR
jgi:tRNA threonylcarbamoyladenosine biosynthesis protein TsaE